MEIGSIVKSKCGHDRNRLYVVVAATGEDFSLVCDGTYRKTDNPKLKRNKHLAVVGKANIKEFDNLTVKRCLSQFCGGIDA